MNLKITGIEKVDYSKRDGKEVHGTSIHGIVQDATFNKDVVGQLTDKLWVSDGSRVVLPAVKPDDVIHVEYNRRGWVDSITLVPSK